MDIQVRQVGKVNLNKFKEVTVKDGSISLSLGLLNDQEQLEFATMLLHTVDDLINDHTTIEQLCKELELI